MMKCPALELELEHVLNKLNDLSEYLAGQLAEPETLAARYATSITQGFYTYSIIIPCINDEIRSRLLDKMKDECICCLSKISGSFAIYAHADHRFNHVIHILLDEIKAIKSELQHHHEETTEVV